MEPRFSFVTYSVGCVFVIVALGRALAPAPLHLREGHGKASPAAGSVSRHEHPRVWPAAAPASAVSESTGSGPADPHGEKLHQLIEDNPATAWERALACSKEDIATWQRVLAQIAQKDAALAATNAARLAVERPELAQLAWAAVLDSLAQSGSYTNACGVLAQVPDGEMKSHLVTNLVLQWGRDDPLAAAEWLAGLSIDLDRAPAFARLGTAWAETQPQEAAELLIRLPSGELRRSSLSAALTAWIEKNPVAASSWMARQEPQPDLDAAAARMARQPELISGRVDIALRWAESINDAETRMQTLGSIVILWADADRAAAVSYVQNSAVLTPAQRAALLRDFSLQEDRL